MKQNCRKLLPDWYVYRLMAGRYLAAVRAFCLLLALSLQAVNLGTTQRCFAL